MATTSSWRMRIVVEKGVPLDGYNQQPYDGKGRHGASPDKIGTNVGTSHASGVSAGSEEGEGEQADDEDDD